MRALAVIVALGLVLGACGSAAWQSTYTLRLREHVEVPISDSDGAGSKNCVAECRAQARLSVADCLLRCPDASREGGPCAHGGTVAVCVEQTTQVDAVRDGRCNSGQELPKNADIVGCREDEIDDSDGPSGTQIVLGALAIVGVGLLYVLSGGLARA